MLANGYVVYFVMLIGEIWLDYSAWRYVSFCSVASDITSMSQNAKVR